MHGRVALAGSMPENFAYDAVVVGAGPNGLAAALRLAQEKLSVLVVEADDHIGGGLHSTELTLPGFVHDVCSAIHPLALGSPFFRTLPLEKYGLHWVEPEFPLAHPLGQGHAVLLDRSLTKTALALGQDKVAYEKLFQPLLEQWEELVPEFLQPLLHVPRHPLVLARFGLNALASAQRLVTKRFRTEPAKALFAGLAAHSFLSLRAPGSAAFGLVLGLLGHAVGWPWPQGGAQRLAEALAAHLRDLGGEIAVNSPVMNIDELPLARAVLLDVTPRQLLRIAGHKLPPSFRARLQRHRYGPGVFKLDYALAQPIPWSAPACRRAGTVHVGGDWGEVCAAEEAVAQGRPAERPFVLVAQPSLFDPTRAPAGRHIGWAYCHVPNGATVDMTDAVERQIERFAPGFRDGILARHRLRATEMEEINPNLVGGDINGGAADLWQLIARPVFSRRPYWTRVPGLYLCSASTPPGGGVHGMCGYWAARTALGDLGVRVANL